MTILPQLERDLASAARQRLPAAVAADTASARQNGSAHPTGLRRPLARIWTASPMLLAIAVAVIIAAVILPLHHAGPSRSPTPAGRTPAARQQLIDMLGVLRRPQTKADLELVRSPLSLVSISNRHARGHPELDRPLVRVVTIPAWRAKVAIEPTTWQPSPTSPRRSEGVDLELWIGSKPTIPPSSDIGTGPQPTSVATLRTHGLALADNGHGQNLLDGVALVPDGVARITLRPIRLGRTGLRMNINRLGAATAAVHDNIAAFQLRIPTVAGRGFATGMFGTSAVAQATWFTAGGNVIRHTTTSLDVLIRVVGSRASPASSSSPAPANPIVRDCLSHGRLTRSYTPARLRHALAVLPPGVERYTNCARVISRAARHSGKG